MASLNSHITKRTREDRSEQMIPIVLDETPCTTSMKTDDKEKTTASYARIHVASLKGSTPHWKPNRHQMNPRLDDLITLGIGIPFREVPCLYIPSMVLTSQSGKLDPISPSNPNVPPHRNPIPEGISAQTHLIQSPPRKERENRMVYRYL